MLRREFIKSTIASASYLALPEINIKPESKKEEIDNNLLGNCISIETGMFSYLQNIGPRRSGIYYTLIESNELPADNLIRYNICCGDNEYDKWRNEIDKVHRFVLTQSVKNKKEYMRNITSLGVIDYIELFIDSYVLHIMLEAESYEVNIGKYPNEIWDNYKKPKYLREKYLSGIHGEYRKFPSLVINANLQNEWWV